MNSPPPATPQAPDFSLVLGGPLYQMYLRSGLVQPPAGRLGRRIVAFIVVAWLPVAVLTLAGGSAFGGTQVPFFADLGVHVRLLVALPLLIAAEVIVHQRVQATVRQFVDRGIIAPADRAKFDGIIASVMRLRNSAPIEIALAVLSVTVGYWVWRERMAMQIGSWYVEVDAAGGQSLTVAGWWYAFVSLNLFRFVLLRWYFRLLVWYVFLWRVSRLRLQLNPLHPDRAGGLGFIGSSVFAFIPLLVAQTAVLSGVIGNRILHESAALPAFYMEIASAVALLMALVLAPLPFFVFQLARAKREGAREYGLLAMRYADQFRDKWLRGGQRAAGEPLIGSADIQSLADLAGAHDVVREMRVLPFSMQTIVRLAMVVAVPYLPLVLAMVPLEELVGRFISKLL
ncbi:MAG TPA: hypothetical protein VFU24_14110 [Burkholderiales bacterium]|nr:hypothetical protein [Burkholderiales bacterium]